MDMLVVQSVLTDPDFCTLLTNKTDLKGKSIKVLSAEISKSDSDLGESDITVVIDAEGKSYGFLIEDKIDAIAMPEQHSRYVKRGEKGVTEGAYDEYRIFIFCPEKYYRNNDEAKLYEHLITYEECKDYFDGKNDLISDFRSEQIRQAIIKAKKPATNYVNEKANAFLKQYICYQKECYPFLDIVTKETRNGWWIDYRTELGSVYVTHKVQKGYVDMTFPKASEKTDRLKSAAEWAKNHKIPNSAVIKTKKSAMIRTYVPELDIMRGFESVDKEDLNQCFEAINELIDFANIVELMRRITDE
ncbi:MAG: hypothetical protein IKD66_07015 [Solobacterium sp.]|nr:hypothetical protein [Solobacterium sp.]